MGSTELSVLEGQVKDLQREVSEMKLSLSGLSTLGPRVEAVETAQRATDARIQHIDRVVMDIQLNLQQLHKSVAAVAEARARDASKLDAILQHTTRVIDLLQK